MVVCNANLNRQDVDDFVAAIERYAGVRVSEEGGNRTFAYALNRTAKDVAYRAAQFTYHADKAQVRAMLDQAPKRGKAKHTSAAAAILAARMTRRGKNPRKFYGHADWVEKVRKFAGRTIRSINFMRAGWLHSARTLARKVHESSGISGSEAFGRRQIDERGEFAKHAYDPALGFCDVAHDEGDVIVVEIANHAVNPRNKTSWSLGLGLHGAVGLSKALAYKAADMLKYIEDVAEAKAKREGLA